MRTIIVDDEKHSRDALQAMLTRFCPNISLLASCSRGAEALEAIKQLKPQLVFLDVEMPGMDGFQLLEAIEHVQFAVIFITAFDQYAIQAIHHSALDYLLKPIDAIELQQAISKAAHYAVNDNSQKVQDLLNYLQQRLKQEERKALPTTQGLKMITARNIIYCKAAGLQTKLFLQPPESQVTIKIAIPELIHWLSDKGFMQVHNDFLVNLSLMDKYIKGDGGEIVMCNGDSIPLSREKKQDFLYRVENL
ncbi:response regulator [Chitinophaga silvatica]|uniref:Response regulator n=1 Tax=Chitinophaga silvatica TaxID=2282649 RepID=A0A3E1YBR3_9BACT|nr:response regulator [Chitinophaga silvatica]RFS23465.1 response regulator [Chitinophaga silvatica]